MTLLSTTSHGNVDVYGIKYAAVLAGLANAGNSRTFKDCDVLGPGDIDRLFACYRNLRPLAKLTDPTFVEYLLGVRVAVKHTGEFGPEAIDASSYDELHGEGAAAAVVDHLFDQRQCDTRYLRRRDTAITPSAIGFVVVWGILAILRMM